MSTLATRIEISADDKASQVFRAVGEQADKTASRLLGMGAATSRALKAAGFDIDSSGLGKFAQQASYLTSQVSTLRKESGGAFGEIKNALLENIALLGRDTQAYIANTQAAIANKTARLDAIAKTISSNTSTINEIEADPFWKWKPEQRQVRHDRLQENSQLLTEQSELTDELAREQKNLADATTVAGNRFGKFGATMDTLKNAGLGLVSFLGGPWAIGLAAAVAGIGYLSRAESEADKSAKAYGVTLEEMAKRYEAIVSGADQAAAATLKHSAVYQQARQQWGLGQLDKLQKAQGEIDRLLDKASDFNSDTSAFSFSGSPEREQEMAQSIRNIANEVKTGGKTAQIAHLEFETLRREWEKTGVSRDFAAVLKSIGVELDFMACNADAARLALDALGKVQPVVGERLQEVAGNLDDKILDAYAKTSAGQRELLVAQLKEAKGWQRVRAGGGSLELEAETNSIVAFRQKALDDFDKGLSKTASSSSKTAQTIAQITDEINKLTMSAREYERYKLDQRLLELGKERGVSPDMLGQLRTATEADWAKRDAKEAEDAAKKNLDIQADFWREYADMGGRNQEAAIRARETALQKEVEIHREAVGDIAELEEWLALKRLSYATDWQSGAARAALDYSRDAQDAAKNVERFFSNTFSSMEDTLVSFTTTGKFEFSSFVNSIIADLARIAVRQAVTGPLASALGSALGGLFTGGSASGSYTASGWSGMPEISWASAKGNVFPSGGELDSYVNSIVRQPTTFAFAKGETFRRGLMGEAGAEAIMPLTRTASGDLGVRATGGAASIEINIIDQRSGETAPAQVQQSETAGGGTRIDILLVDALDTAFAERVMRGTSKTGNAISKKNGTNPMRSSYFRS